MKKLTMEQAIAVSAYTGVLICPFDKLHKAIEKKLDRPVFTHELGTDVVAENVKDAFKADFLALAPNE